MTTWLEDAAQITREDREKAYGAPLINFLRTALLWSVYLRHTVTPLDVVWLMVQVKVAREMNKHHNDNCLDAIGYISCWQSMDESMRLLGYEAGALALKDMGLDEMASLIKRIENDASS